MGNKKKIMIFMGRYLPGYKDGGPVRTILNLVDTFHGDYELLIVTNDRDHKDVEPYKDIKRDSWNRVGEAKVFYVPDNKWSFKFLYTIVKNSDLIYCCGPYNNYTFKILLLNRFKLLPSPLIVAPMGSFSEGAFKIKSFKKKLYISFLQFSGLASRINWSVTSEIEKRETQGILKNQNLFYIAEDLPRKPLDSLPIKYKKSGEINIVFMSRISKKKNLDGAIEILKNIKGKINFSIYGYIEDYKYWEYCEKILKSLPVNIKWDYKGEADSETVLRIFSGYDVFLFPTKGENFGHVIYEALAAGCVPVISNTTPWLDFDEKNCGHVVPLNEKKIFQSKIANLLEMDYVEFNEYRKNANLYAKEKYKKSRYESGYINLFKIKK